MLDIVDMLGAREFVSEDEGTSSVPGALRPAVVQAIYTEGAPFTVHLEPGAIPVVEQPSRQHP